MGTGFREAESKGQRRYRCADRACRGLMSRSRRIGHEGQIIVIVPIIG